MATVRLYSRYFGGISSENQDIKKQSGNKKLVYDLNGNGRIDSEDWRQAQQFSLINSDNTLFKKWINSTVNTVKLNKDGLIISSIDNYAGGGSSSRNEMVNLGANSFIKNLSVNTLAVDNLDVDQITYQIGFNPPIQNSFKNAILDLMSGYNGEANGSNGIDNEAARGQGLSNAFEAVGFTGATYVAAVKDNYGNVTTPSHIKITNLINPNASTNDPDRIVVAENNHADLVSAFNSFFPIGTMIFVYHNSHFIVTDKNNNTDAPLATFARCVPYIRIPNRN